MSIFRHNGKEDAGLEIISVHIPKTAGRSFREILKQVYGPSCTVISKREHLLKSENIQLSIGKQIPKDAKAIHGHFTVGQIKEAINRYDTKVITWVRDPVERVISNYYFLMRRIRSGNVKEKVKRKKDFTLIRYAEQARNMNRMTKLLSGLELADFFFIGVMERFMDDVKELASLMEWTEDLQIPHINSNKSFKNSDMCATPYNEIDEQMRSTIAEMNQDDIKQYQEILNMRGISLNHEPR